MPARELPDKFLVAFSFAGEQRDLVRAIAEEVEKRLGPGTVFFDEWFEHYIAGHDADKKLQSLYGKRCELAAVCVSARYGDKPWTLAEHSAISERLMKARSSRDERDELGILPIRVGDGDVEGIPFNAIVPDVRGRGADKTAELILNRLRLIVPDAGRGTGELAAQNAARRIYLAEATPDMKDLRRRMQSFLEGLGWSVLPTNPYPTAEFQTRLAADLRECRAFVQLLGFDPLEGGAFDRIRSEAAVAVPIVRYRYRSSAIGLDKVEGAHREFLAAPDVIACGFEDFKVHLEKELGVLAQQPDRPPASDIPPRVLVALRCENPDSLWEKVFQWIYEQEQMDHYQLRAGESVEVTFQAEPCHGFLVVCDGTALNDDDQSPRKFMEQCRQIQLKQKDPNRRPPVGLVYWPPPSASWARLLRSTPLKLQRILGDQPTNLREFFAEVRRVAR